MTLVHVGSWAQEVQSPEIVPYYSSAPIHVDGKLTESAWEKATLLPDFNNAIGSASPHLQTEVRLIRDDRSLCVAFICFDPLVEFIQTTSTRHDSPVWQEDHVAVFLEPAGSSDSYSAFGVNAFGIRAEARYPDLGTEWDAMWLAKAGKRQGYWIAEIQIPFSALAFDQAPGTVWRFNAVRYVARTDTFYSWAPVEKSVHEPRNFGRLLEMKVDLSRHGFGGSLQELFPCVLGANRIDFVIHNQTRQKKRMRARVETTDPEGKINYTFSDFKLAAGEKRVVEMSYNLFKPGQHFLDLIVEDTSTRENVLAFLDIPVTMPVPLELVLDRSVYTSEEYARLQILFRAHQKYYKGMVCAVHVLSETDGKILLEMNATTNLISGEPVALYLPSLLKDQPPQAGLKIKAQVRDSEGVLIASTDASLRRSPQERIPIQIDKVTGLVILDDKPFLPLGVYWADMREMSDIASAGFNICGVTCTPADFIERQTVFDEAERNNLRTLCGFSDLHGPSGLHKESLVMMAFYFKPRASLVAWNVAHEPAETGVSVDQVKEIASVVREVDPTRPLQITENWPERFADDADLSDILCIEPDTEDRPLPYAVRDQVAAARPILGSGKTLWVAFPSPEEATNNLKTYRNASYLALLQGARGVFFYRQDPSQTTSWLQWTPLLNELKTLTDVWVAPFYDQDIVMEPNDGEVLLDMRVTDSWIYLIAINQADRQVARTFHLPRRLRPERVEVMFENRVFAKPKRQFVDTFEPWDVHVYRFSRPR